MNKHIWVLQYMIVLWSILLTSCSGKKLPANITQYADPTYVTGIALYDGAVYCATKGGLVKWEFPEKKFTIYTTADGLPGNVLSDVVADEEGLLWVGSNNGIGVFDGTSWKYYNESHGLPSAEINDLELDRNGKMWIATASGVASFERGSFSVLEDKGSPGRQAVNCVYFDLGNNIWICSENEGIFTFSEDRWSIWDTKSGLATNDITAITQAWDRSMWCSSWMAIQRSDGVGWKSYSSKDNLGTFEARYLKSTGDRLWFFTPNGVHALKGMEWFHFTEDEGLISNDVTCGFIKSNNEVYVGTIDGMSVITDGTIENYFIPNSLVGHNCISVSIDEQDRIWIGTWETGLSLNDSGYWIQPAAQDESLLETVRSIVYAPDGGMVFNTISGVVFYNNNMWKRHMRINGVSGNDVRCGIYDSEGRYWAGTESGICFYDKGRWRRLREAHGLPSEDTWACAKDSNNILWFGTTKGIVSISDNVMSDRTSEIGLENVDVRSIAIDGDRVLFGTTDGKVIVYENGSWDVYGNSYLDTEKGIYAIAVEPSGDIWFGTDGDGIILCNNGNKSRYTTEDGLPSNYVRALAFKNGILWVACYEGVATIEVQRDEK
ncbi:two-component regulator propeller domain-containing protein [Candidatus Latescibacterota bacterium]